jgi:hypothetical protein
MIAVPVHQGHIAGIFKKKVERRRFNMAIAENRVAFADGSMRFPIVEILQSVYA